MPMNSSKKSASKINLILGLTLLFVLGCVNIDEDIVLEDLSAREIFINAEKAWGNGDNEKAAELFLEIERIYPYSELAKQALLNNAIVLMKRLSCLGSLSKDIRKVNFLVRHL